MIERVFKLKEHNTDVKTEIIAGVITFMTMAYILAVNPSILSDAGMDSTAVMLATCIASFIGTACMGLMANLPFALSAGMGLNAFLAYTVVIGNGYPWQMGLLSVFVEGIVFIILSLTRVREALFNCIPLSLKHAVAVGMGLFIALIGLQNAGLVKLSTSSLSIVDFRESFHTSGICALLAVVGLFGMIFMHIKKTPGGILIGIIGTWFIGIICQLVGLYIPDAQNGYYSLIPSFELTDFTRLGNTFGQCFNVDFSGVKTIDFIIITFSFLFFDLFDTMGTLIGVAAKTDMLDKEGKLPGIRPALLADAIATSVGAVFGTSTTTTFVESAAGVGAGGRTGLTALTTGVLFLIAMLFAPIFIAIPSFATAPALILVGFQMFGNITRIKFDGENLLNAIPSYLCIIAMPMFSSIAEGISFGVISYVVIHLICGKAKKVSPIMYILSVMFILKYIVL